jgi:hypothetical protein
MWVYLEYLVFTVLKARPLGRSSGKKFMFAFKQDRSAAFQTGQECCSSMLCPAGRLRVLRSQHFTLRFSERFSLSASDVRGN